MANILNPLKSIPSNTLPLRLTSVSNYTICDIVLIEYAEYAMKDIKKIMKNTKQHISLHSL